MSTIKGIVQEFCGRTGLPKPSFVAASTDVKVSQILGLANEGLEDIWTRKRLEAVNYTASFTSVSGTDQGALSALAPSGYSSIIPRTMWDQTEQLEIPGSLDSKGWQEILTGFGQAVWGQYRVIANHLHLTPNFPVGHTITFEYNSTWYVTDSGGTGKEYFTDDADTFVLPDRVLLAYLRWKWKEEKGLDYAEAFAQYERIIETFEIREASPKAIDAAGCGEYRSGVIVPATAIIGS